MGRASSALILCAQFATEPGTSESDAYLALNTRLGERARRSGQLPPEFFAGAAAHRRELQKLVQHAEENPVEAFAGHFTGDRCRSVARHVEIYLR